MSEKILDSRYRTHIQHLKSIGQSGRTEDGQYYDNGLSPNLPSPEDLLLGEIALNVAPGTETIAIKNYNGEIVFIPFNVAKKIKALGQESSNNMTAINATNERLTILSADTLTHFESIQELINALSGDTRVNVLSGVVESLSSKTDNNIERIDNNISELSSFTHTQIDTLSGLVDNHTEALENIGERIEEISQNVVEGTNERLEELSAATMTALSENALEHQVLSGQISSVSGDLRTDLNIVSGIAENASELAQTASDSIADLISATMSTNEGLRDVSDRLDGINSRVSGNTERINVIEYGLEEISGKTDTNTTNLNVVSGNLDTLSAYTLSVITQNDIDHRRIIQSISGNVEYISEEIQNGLNEVSGKVETLTENEGNLRERLDSLSAKTDSAITQNNADHQEIINSLSDQISSVSGDLRTDLNIVSGIAENASELAQTASEGLDEVNGRIDSEIARVEGGIANVEVKVDAVSGNVRSSINQISNGLGFYNNGTGIGYHPTSENLQDFNVTQSLDYINEKLNEDILSGETRYANLIRIILEDEKVTANFAATINSSCGFDIHAKYNPATEFLKGLNVTQAIDTIYTQVEEDIASSVTNVRNEINTDIDAKLDELRSGLTEVIISGDTALSERIDGIEQWFYDSTKQPLEVSVTYDQLLYLFLMGQLRSGMLYRITNYQATVDTEFVDATTNYPEPDNFHYDANDGFDILVRATSNWTLNENALAMELPRNDTDPKNFPEAWEIKYSLINDVSRFSWALDRGHGVIYYMKDQYGNEAPYDFKNIKVAGHYLFEDAEGNDASNSGVYRNNVINPTYTEDHKLKLNNIHFVAAENAEGNVFKPGCQNISIGGVFRNNTISPIKNGESLINKENTFLGFYYE